MIYIQFYPLVRSFGMGVWIYESTWTKSGSMLPVATCLVQLETNSHGLKSPGATFTVWSYLVDRHDLFDGKKMGQLGSRFGWFFKDGREETNFSTKKIRFPFGAQKRCSWGGGEFLHKMQLTFKHGKVIHLEETAGMIFAGAVFWIQRLDLQMNTKYIQYIYIHNA